MSKRHQAILALLLVALLAAYLAGRGSVSSGQSKPQVHETVKHTAESAAVIAQNVPNPDCNPAQGAGRLGACAPVQAMGAANALGKAAGDPDHISGTLGVDVSSYQGCGVNWSAQHVAFAFFKATESTGYTDACARHNVASAKVARKPYGLYDFLRPAPYHSAIAEADHFADVVISVGGNTSLPPVADVEANVALSGQALHGYVCAWVARVKARLHRSSVIVYTGNWFWGAYVAGDSCGSILWDSAYATFAVTPFSWLGHGGITIWQYSDGIYGPTPHINGWDSDVLLKGTLAQLLGARPIALATSSLLHTRNELRVDLTRHHCRIAPYHGRGRYHRVCARWLSHGREVNHQLHERGIR